MTRILFAFVLSILLAGFAGSAARSACAGRDLIAAQPPDVAAAFRATLAGVSYSEGLIWRAERGAQVIHLVGTYHFDDPRHEALVARIAPLVARAEMLLVEATAQEEAALMVALAERPEVLFITDGPTLSERLSGPDRRALADALQARGIPPVLASRFRPWYVATVLSLPPCAMEQVHRGGRGLDHRIMALAQARGLPVAPLERFDTLFRLFDTMSEVDEIGLVTTMIHMADTAEDMSVTLANAYFREEPWAIWELSRAQALADPAVSAETAMAQIEMTEDVLMTARNIAWIPVLTKAAARGEVLAAFGALHLPGPQGVLALLAAEGYTIKRLP